MSEDSKSKVKEAELFFQRVKENSEQYRNIPDKKLNEKIKKVQESAGEVVEHIKQGSEQ